MKGILDGLRIVEAAAFVAAPMAGVTLAQMGADVIRIDPIGGGLDYRRWPVTADGTSLYWSGLNKGKRSIAVNLDLIEGQELARSLIVAPGTDAGIFVTNLSASGPMSYASLIEKRPDLIMVHITGSPDGAIAVDYTVNSAVGFPAVTGRSLDGEPINHVLPAWDSVCAMVTTTAILAAERHRRTTGQGQYVRIALSDVAMAVVGNLGYLAEVEINSTERKAHGNDVYGTFGRDFITRDGRRLMILAITPRQWKSLLAAMDLGKAVQAIESTLGIDCFQEADRWGARESLFPLVEDWVLSRDFDEVRSKLDDHHVLWGPYQTFTELVANDKRCSIANPMFEEVDHPGIGKYLTPGLPIEFSQAQRVPAGSTPRLGEHTEEVLSELLGLDQLSIEALRKKGLVGSDG